MTRSLTIIFLWLGLTFFCALPSYADDLVDLEGSGVNKFGTLCAVVNTSVKGALKGRDLKDALSATTEAETQTARAMAQVFYDAQEETGVSIDDIDPVLLGEYMSAVQSEYQASLPAQQTAPATLPSGQAGEKTDEEWTAFDIARTSLSVASIADPTGVVGVAAAYTYPKCGTEDALKGQGGFCWKDSEPRGLGTLPKSFGRVSDCPAGFTNNGLTCGKSGDTIPQASRVADCPTGYTNNGATCGRGGHTIAQASRVADCPAGYTNNGATCGRGGHTIPQASRVADCPAGYTNNGLTCGRGGDTYWKGCTTVFKKYSCRSGYTDTGCTCTKLPSTLGMGSMVCKAGEFKTGARCYKNCPSGYTNAGEFCTKPPSTLGMGSMLCKAGEFKTGARCYKNCPTGYTNTGEFCTKPPSTLGMGSMSCKVGEFKTGARCYKKCPAGYTNTGEQCTRWPETKGWSAMSCKLGEIQDGLRCYPADACGDDKELNAGLCYRKCSNPNFTGIGPVCWSSCQGKLGTACAAGCATTAAECGLATTDMVLSPIEVAVSVASIGSYSSAKSARKAATIAARQAAKAAAKEAAEAGVKKAGKALAEEALKKLSRESVEFLELDLIDDLIKYSDDLAAEAKELADAKIFKDAEEAAAHTLQFRQAADRIASTNPAMMNRIQNSITTSAKVSARNMKDFAAWFKTNGKRLKDSAKAKLYEPAKKAKDYVPNKLRSKSEVFDIFMQQKSKYNSFNSVGVPRTARQCGKIGFTIAIEAGE